MIIDHLKIMVLSKINSGLMKKKECAYNLRIWKEDINKRQHIETT